MLISLLLILYNLGIAFFSGLIFNRLLSGFSGLPCNPLHPSLHILSGWAFLAMQLQLIHLFMPVNGYAHLIIWGVNIALASMRFKAYLKDAVASIHFIAGRRQLAFALLFILTGVLNICTRRADGDIGDYHLQAARWVEEYKVVPGIGNIVRQLGNNSNWFLLNAFSGLSFLGLRSVYVMNACIVLISGLYLVPRLTQRFWVRNFILLCYLLVVVTRKYTGALTNDTVITCSIIILFCWFTDLCAARQSNKAYEQLLIIILSMALVTYKLSALPMLLFAAGVFILMYRHASGIKRPLATLAGVGLFLYVPWLITNVMHSGYLAFPVAGTNLFGVDWQMRSEIIDYEKDLNFTYAITQGKEIPMETVLNMRFSEWFPMWAATLDIFSKAVLIMNVLFFPVLLIALAVRKTFRQFFLQNHLWLVTATIFIALFLWFTHGPNTRFVFGYMMFVVAMGVELLHITPLIRLLQSYKYHVSTALGVLMLAMVVYVNYTPAALKKSLLLPPRYHQSNVTRLNVDGGVLHVTSLEEQCWDCALPCTSQPDSLLQFRGKSLEDGFRIRR